ncbi:stage III sporulation protein SpoIIIAB [Amphibacillus sediminis]|uniref:stage III sporulation protein SpoIIIAB n=1 Tax=Amphibacillus sediminis TaxID=360185 RepID=UPI00082E198B|nr:stage III sporulation protein SpoIIIAB [Amphibacillus sediminis]
MNWIGAMLLIAATTLIGFDRSDRLKKRPQQLRQLKTALQIMEAEIIYSQHTIRSVCQHVSNQIPNPLAHFFNLIANKISDSDDLALLWTQELKQLKSYTALEQHELDILQQFGNTLGQFDTNQQQKQIQLTLVHLDRLLAEAHDNYLALSKVYRGIGVLSGILIALVLI